MKEKIDEIIVTPSKRIFRSIIADYDLNKSICELIDNALDIWIKNGKKNIIKISIEIDLTQKSIRVIDNAGGVKQSELKVIVGPGHTSNKPEDKTIGIFGVGTKRAVVALAQDIEITTRHINETTCQVGFDDDWLKDEDWHLDVFKVDEIDEGNTIIDLNRLRIDIDDKAILNLKEHLEATYANFLSDNNVIMVLNNDPLKPLTFNNWAFPPDFPPHKFHGELQTEEGKKVKVEVIAGLTTKSSPAKGEYGVYFYCNKRLIARALKSYDVGFTSGLVGLPHASISTTKVIVSLEGDTQCMPWNSSKSSINPNHPVFIAIRDWLIQQITDFASLSRKWVSVWQEQVFKFTSGEFKDIHVDFPEAKKSYLPPFPKTKKHYSTVIKQKNKNLSSDKPWTRGLYEAILAVDSIYRQNLDQKNRICLLLLDSTVEIAFKEYLVNEVSERYGEDRLRNIFKDRIAVHREIKRYKSMTETIWNKIQYYYDLRCDLIHKRSTANISDPEIVNFRNLVEDVLRRLFGLDFNLEDEN